MAESKKIQYGSHCLPLCLGKIIEIMAESAWKRLYSATSPSLPVTIDPSGQDESLNTGHSTDAFPAIRLQTTDQDIAAMDNERQVPTEIHRYTLLERMGLSFKPITGKLSWDIAVGIFGFWVMARQLVQDRHG